MIIPVLWCTPSASSEVGERTRSGGRSTRASSAWAPCQSDCWRYSGKRSLPSSPRFWQPHLVVRAQETSPANWRFLFSKLLIGWLDKDKYRHYLRSHQFALILNVGDYLGHSLLQIFVLIPFPLHILMVIVQTICGSLLTPSASHIGGDWKYFVIQNMS